MSTAATFYSLVLIVLGLGWSVTGQSQSLSYDDIMAQERDNRSQERAFEQIVGGTAATMIGLYGYYNDDRGLLVKLAYGSIQTSGVVVLCRALFALNDPSLLLAIDNDIRGRDSIETERLRRQITEIHNQRQHSSQLTLATSSAILGSLYLYNGIRSQADETQLKNIFYFLGANMYLVSGVTWYRIWKRQSLKNTSVTASIDLAPWPELKIVF